MKSSWAHFINEKISLVIWTFIECSNDLEIFFKSAQTSEEQIVEDCSVALYCNGEFFT